MPAQKIFFTSRIRLMTRNYLLVSNVLYADISQRHGRVKFRREHETLSRDFAVVNLGLYRRGEVTRMIFARWLEYIHIYRGTYRVVCPGRKQPAIHGITCSRVVIATLHKHGLASCRRGTNAKPFYIADRYPSVPMDIDIEHPLCLPVPCKKMRRISKTAKLLTFIS